MAKPSLDTRTRALADSSHLDSNVGVGMDIALVAFLFMFFGWLLDRWLGTHPLFIIVLSVLALVGQGVRMYFLYEHKMRALEAQRAEAARATQRAGA